MVLRILKIYEDSSRASDLAWRARHDMSDGPNNENQPTAYRRDLYHFNNYKFQMCVEFGKYKLSHCSTP